LIENTEKLTKEFGKGFSVANVWNFRQFYLIFPENEILYALRRELTWTHYHPGFSLSESAINLLQDGVQKPASHCERQE
jgi:DUF1016 N-terminal domain